MASYLLGDNRANTLSSGNLIHTTTTDGDSGTCTDHLLCPPAKPAASLYTGLDQTIINIVAVGQQPAERASAE